MASDNKSTPNTPTKELRLIQYLAQAGICSRRKAAEYIQTGAISINGSVCKDPWYVVLPEDKVFNKNKLVRLEEKIYILLNKPKDSLCTNSDQSGRRTVFDLVKHPTTKNVTLHTVGRLDCNSTGLIILTNDGELTQQVAHPRYEMNKRYTVTLHQPLQPEHMQQLLRGIELEDGISRFDSIKTTKASIKKPVYSVELHNGKNRIIRRLFKQLGYFVIDLDRTGIAKITKKDLPISHWRFLTAGEINSLKKSATAIKKNIKKLVTTHQKNTYKKSESTWNKNLKRTKKQI